MNQLIIILLLSSTAYSDTYHYCYSQQELKVTVEANSEREGFIKAGRVCYQALTRGTYPGEDAGLAIIDVCANPIKCSRSNGNR